MSQWQSGAKSNIVMVSTYYLHDLNSLYLYDFWAFKTSCRSVDSTENLTKKT